MHMLLLYSVLALSAHAEGVPSRTDVYLRADAVSVSPASFALTPRQTAQFGCLRH